MNRIYCFTGTGNSLKLSQDIAEHIGDSDIVPVNDSADTVLPPECDRVGFVFPVYFQGLPGVMDRFLQRIDLSASPDAYYFAAATYGALAGNALAQIARSLSEKGTLLHYGAKLVMFSNCVTLYNMKKQVAQITDRSQLESIPIIQAIARRETVRTPRFNGLLHRYYRYQIGRVHQIGQGLHAGDSCTACGLCLAVCPAGNIAMQQGKPAFHESCEHCTACLQYCPAKALNYKDRTQARRRYHHPAVSGTALRQFRLDGCAARPPVL